MHSYAARRVFSSYELRQWRCATELVQAIPDTQEWRCHEIARAVGHVLGMPVVDGKCGAVEHSWLLCMGNILDVYVPGAVPQVQLLHAYVMLPWGDRYVAGSDRDDIRSDEIRSILEAWGYVTKELRVWPMIHVEGKHDDL